MSDPLDALTTELATFEAHLHEWVSEQGRFALIAGTNILGIYDTYQDAVTAGYSVRGLDPFLVKQIAAVAKIANFTRHIRPACHTLAA